MYIPVYTYVCICIYIYTLNPIYIYIKTMALLTGMRTWSGTLGWRTATTASASCASSPSLQGYLAHKKQPPPLGPPEGPGYSPAVGS